MMRRLEGRQTLLEPVTDEQVASTIGGVLMDMARAASPATPRARIDWPTLRVEIEPGRIFGDYVGVRVTAEYDA